MHSTGENFDQQENMRAIDALRGYAILLVISVHATPYMKDLVWPVKRVLLLGVYGVQLFFIASALTLLMSWSRSQDDLGAKCAKFLTRRFLRIAPLYYLAIVFYWLVNQHHLADFSGERLLATLAFYNAWSPYLIPTVPGWMPVPGGWSISVEFCFYFIFPLLAISVTTLRRAIFFTLTSLFVLIIVSFLQNNVYPELTFEQRANFLYFYPPNQLIIFAIGFVLYHLVKHAQIRNAILNSRVTIGMATALLLIVCLALSIYGQQKFFHFSSGTAPTHLIITLAFMLWALVLVIRRENSIVINRLIVSLGKVSFSAYVLHFAVLKLVGAILQKNWPFHTEGIASIPYSFVLIAISLALTWQASALTYKYIEQPFIALGKRLSMRMTALGKILTS